MAGFIEYVNTLEGNLCLRINRLSYKASIRRFFSAISKLGDGWFWMLMALAMYWLQGVSSWPLIVQMSVTSVVGIVVYKLLKTRLVRERPYINFDGILCGTAPLDKYSFPSGHTLHAVSFTTMLWAFEPLLCIAAMPFAILVAASRVILGLHYPSDVIVGAAIGATLASASLILN